MDAPEAGFKLPDIRMKPHGFQQGLKPIAAKI
jgi:hypothetical protein